VFLDVSKVGWVTEKYSKRPPREDGSAHILVGTHALLEDTVQFANLGCVVIYEQDHSEKPRCPEVFRKQGLWLIELQQKGVFVADLHINQ
jgi:hypothetical protein